MEQPGWFYAVNGQAFGPVSGEQLVQLAASAHFGPQDLVLREDMTQWVKAQEVPGLFFPAASPLPQPGLPGTSAELPGSNAGWGYPSPDPYAGIPTATPYLDYSGPRPRQHRTGQSQMGMAVAGFVLSLTVPLLGLIFSWIALSGMQRSRNEEGKGLAIAGLVISIVWVSLVCLIFSLGGLRVCMV